MRLMLQLLEHRLRSRKTCVGLGLRTPFDTVVAKRLKRVLRYLFTYTLSATTYKNILWYLLARCCGVQPRHPFVSSHELQPTPAEPGPHFATRHEKYPLADRVLELIPESILRGTVCKHICWGCHSVSTPTRVCSLCLMARYCTVDCQKNDWHDHMQACHALRASFTADHRRWFQDLCNGASQSTYRDALLRVLAGDRPHIISTESGVNAVP